MKLRNFALLGLLFSLPLQAEETSSTNNDPRMEQMKRGDWKPGRRKGKRRDRMGNLKKTNPELFEKLQAARKSWKGMKKEEREKSKNAFFDAHPELKEKLNQNSQRRKAMKKRLNSLSEKERSLLKSKREEWKKLSKIDRAKARKEFLQSQPKIQKALQSGKNKRNHPRFAKIEKENPELAAKMKAKRQEWANLSREERKTARQKYLKENPDVKEALQKIRKNRGKKGRKGRRFNRRNSSNQENSEG